MEKTRRIIDQIQEFIMKIVKYSLLVVGMALFVYALSENFSFLIESISEIMKSKKSKIKFEVCVVSN